jgi:hypothetical protein
MNAGTAKAANAANVMRAREISVLARVLENRLARARAANAEQARPDVAAACAVAH